MKKAANSRGVKAFPHIFANLLEYLFLRAEKLKLAKSGVFSRADNG